MHNLVRACLACLLVLLPGAVLPARALEAIYQLRQTGIAVVEISARFEDRADGYWVSSRSRAVGIGQIFVPHEILSEVRGLWRAEGVAPQHFQSIGNWRGDARRIVLLYRDGMPEALEMEPPEGVTNEPVPPSARQGAIDVLSAFALMSRRVVQTGGCDLSGPIFDGRRRLDWSSTTIGTARVNHAGQELESLQCRLESRLVAGMRPGDDPARAKQPRPAIAWLAKVDARLPPIPIRVEFPGTIFGAMRMDLMSVR